MSRFQGACRKSNSIGRNKKGHGDKSMTTVEGALDRHCSVNALVHIMHEGYASAAGELM